MLMCTKHWLTYSYLRQGLPDKAFVDETVVLQTRPSVMTSLHVVLGYFADRVKVKGREVA